jgi:hypothetical protein
LNLARGSGKGLFDFEGDPDRIPFAADVKTDT